MIFGLSIEHFTTLHVIISLIGIITGLVVLYEMLRGRNLPVMTAIFLATTVLTSVTGFMFGTPFSTPANIVGGISLVLLALALIALYATHLEGAGRPLYVVSAIAALYLNCFVAVVQAFQKIEGLQKLAPTQTETPFVGAQAALLLAFIVLGALAVRRFHPMRAPRFAGAE